MANFSVQLVTFHFNFARDNAIHDVHLKIN